MISRLQCTALCFAAITSACGEEGINPAAPSPTDVPPAAVVLQAVVKPAIALSANALYYCYTPGGNRMCVVLQRGLRITSTGPTALKWTATVDHSWIILSRSAGTTPTNVTVSVDPKKLPSWRPAYGRITIAAAGASNSPQVILVKVGFVPYPL